MLETGLCGLSAKGTALAPCCTSSSHSLEAFIRCWVSNAGCITQTRICFLLKPWVRSDSYDWSEVPKWHRVLTCRGRYISVTNAKCWPWQALCACMRIL